MCSQANDAGLNEQHPFATIQTDRQTSAPEVARIATTKVQGVTGGVRADSSTQSLTPADACAH